MSAMDEIFHECKRWNVPFKDEMFHSTTTRLCLLEWNISSFTPWKYFVYLFYITWTKLHNLKQFFKKYWKKTPARAKPYRSCTSNSMQEILCRHLCHAALSPRRVLHLTFLISLILKANVWRLYSKHWTLQWKCECWVQ